MVYSAPYLYTDYVGSLAPGTLYHCRIVAQSSGGTTYGSDSPFTTGETYAPGVETYSATAVTMTSAQFNGYVSDDGGLPTTVWFEYGPTTSYGYSTSSAGGMYTGDSPCTLR